MTSDAIKDLLADKHSNDVFVTECKNGPSGAGLLKLDAWAMRKSWSNFSTIGYEIKISRSDFLSDTKWPGYLDYCHEFYFVCPTGVISPAELGPDVGLAYVSKTGSRIFTKKKAPYRNIKLPQELLVYILMCRTQIVESTFGRIIHSRGNSHEANLKYWRNFMAEKNECRDIGYRASEKIRKLIREKIDDVERENRRLQSEVELYQEIKIICDEACISPNRFRNRDDLKQKLSELLNGGGKVSDIFHNIDWLTEQLTALKNSISNNMVKL
ncbi:MAG: MmcB family DNA repair protein [Deltaproteobacteria bacterium]|nr:MmcB family DNA repair protein [Deltaproteobacteria bacterium]